MIDINEIKEFLAGDWNRTQAIIKGSLSTDISLLQSINSSILEHSGKQLRPMLSLLVARACNAGRASEATCQYAAAVELLHNATLLHDDVADDSDQRRGCPTVKSLLGPSAAVLIGDYWLVKAVECVLRVSDKDSAVTSQFTSTLRHLAEGEMFQLQKAGSADTTEDDYFRIISDKTASMFRTAAFSAASSVDAPDAIREAVCSYAEKLGLAFQIKDDMFDYSPEANVGKPVGADILEGKITLPLLGAFAALPQEEARIRRMVADIQEKPESRDEIASYVLAGAGLEYARGRMDALLDQAVLDLAVLEESKEKEYLVALAGYVGDRNI